jgi:hypothetical protein
MTSPKHEPLVLSAEEREVLVGGRGRDAGLHFHDLRHTGNNLAGGKGASLRELKRASSCPPSWAATDYSSSPS